MALNPINNGGKEQSFYSDIYDIEETLVDVRIRYIEDESEDTLNVGIFGFISDTEEKKIQSDIIFPSRAKQIIS